MLQLNELILQYEKRMQELQERVNPYRKDRARLDKLRNNEYLRMEILESEIRHIKWSLIDLKTVLYHDYNITSERVE